MSEAMLQVSKLTKQFGGITAVNDVSFHVDANEIVAIIGPNGAGKTTLFNMITGVTPPTSGDIYLRGEKINNIQVNDLAHKGISRTFQNLQIFHNMTVLENVMLGAHIKLKTGILGAAFNRFLVRREDKLAYEMAAEALEKVGLQDRMYEVAGELSYGLQKMLEVARAIVSAPPMLLLDEPMAGLNDGEKARLSDLLLDLKQQGYTLLFVEHDMKTVMRVAERIVVINFGSKIADGPPEAIKRDPQVIAAYLGEEDY